MNAPSVGRSAAHRTWTDCAVFGDGKKTKSLVDNCFALGLRPVALCSPYGTFAAGEHLMLKPEVIRRKANEANRDAGEIPESLEVLDVESFKDLTQSRALPVFVGSYLAQERDYFRDYLLYAKNHLKMDVAVLHPAALCDEFSFPPGRYLISAFPGSGNMIVQRAAQMLLDGAVDRPAWHVDRLGSELVNYALNYWYSLASFIESRFDDLGRWQVLGGPSHTRFGSDYIRLSGDVAPSVISGLPMRSYAWANPWTSSHEPLTRAGIDFFDNQGFEIVQIVRNPLDIVVSNAAKITSESGDRVPEILLQDDRWVIGMLQQIERYFSNLVSCAHRVHTIRYEELLSDPLGQLRRLAEILQCRIDDKAISKGWETLSGKPLHGTEGTHFWDPRAGKWREYLPARFAPMIMSSKLREYATALGYRIEEGDFGPGRPVPAAHGCDPLYLAWLDAHYEHPTGKAPTLKHSEVSRCRDPSLPLLTTTRRAHRPVMDALLASATFQDMLRASGFEAWPEPGLVSDYLDLKE